MLASRENKGAHHMLERFNRLNEFEMTILHLLISSFRVVNLHFTPFKAMIITELYVTYSKKKKKQKVNCFQSVNILLLLLSIIFDSHPLRLVSKLSSPLS